MEVIQLDDRINSTTILNTASPSDAPEDVTNVYTDDYNDGNFNEGDAPILLDDEDLSPAEAGATAAAAGGGLMAGLSRNKLLLALLAGSALLCAMATGGGVAIRRARVNASRKCTVADLVPGIGALSPGAPGTTKSSKSPGTTKSSKSPSTASLVTTKSTSTNKSAGGGGAPTRRRLVENNYLEEEGEGWIVGKGEEAHGHRRRLQNHLLRRSRRRCAGNFRCAQVANVRGSRPIHASAGWFFFYLVLLFSFLFALSFFFLL